VKTTRLLLALTLVNLGLFAFQVVQLQKAHSQSDAAILRGRGIEILDDQGRLRMQLTIAPENHTFKMPDGKTGYPETVIFRLITADGKPRVKLTTSIEGSGLMLLGDSDTTHTILQANGAKTSLKLRNNESTEQVLKP
jgi:hypothetical protein